MIMAIEFKSFNPATNLARLEEFQQAVGIILPRCYRDFLLFHNGGR